MTLLTRLVTLTLVLAASYSTAWGAPDESENPQNSQLNSTLFYQLLVSELSAQNGDAGSAYSLMLDAARKAHSARLYERAVELALLARSGESALQAAQAWSRALPTSREANRYLLQILIGLNRTTEILEPLKRNLAGLPPKDRIAAIALLPRYFSRASDKAIAASTVEQALAVDLSNALTGPTAWATIGRLRLMAGDADGALAATRRGVALDPRAEEPILLAFNLTGSQARAVEPLILKHLSGKPSTDIRMAYVRQLLDTQRLADSYAQIQLINTESPDFAEAWLIRGSLEAQDRRWDAAKTSLTRFITLNTTPPETSQTPESARGTVQALLVLAQIAEQSQQWDEALAYLARIDSPQDALRIEGRRAMIWARQGRLDEARALIRNIPEQQAEDARAKISLEVQLLRDYKQYPAAYQVLADAVARDPQDVDLAYDMAMVAEKLDKLAEMEQLLRQVIALKPDYHHAYNALGYSLADRSMRLPEARQLIQKALEFTPNDPYIMDSLAWVEFRSGNAAQALDILKNAYLLRPDAEIAAHLGEVLWTLGQHSAATDIWQQGMGLNPNNDTLIETMKRLRPAP